MRTGIVLAALAAVALPLAASAQTSAPAAPAQTEPPPFRLGLGDLMIAVVQPHHIHLALSAKAKNWPYAAFEVKELKETFDRIGRLYPNIQGKPSAPMLAVVKEPLDALDEATRTGNAKEYKAAYQRFTAGCNACHALTNIGGLSIIIKDPSPSLVPDQDFRPQKH